LDFGEGITRSLHQAYSLPPFGWRVDCCSDQAERDYVSELTINIIVLAFCIPLAIWQKKHLSWSYLTAGKRALLGFKGILCSALIAFGMHIFHRGFRQFWEWPLWASAYLIALATFRRKDIIVGKGKKEPADDD
jgi:hypothetical protein